MPKHLALTIMVKDEENSILKTLSTVKDVVDSLIVYDTGSTDHTLDLIENFCIEQNLKLNLLKGTFENFAKSRNKLLDFAEGVKDVDYLLLLDSNDELLNGKELREFVDEKATNEAYYITHIWKLNNDEHHFKNVNLVTPLSGWRYTGVVHEYLGKGKKDIAEDPCLKTCIYQNRDEDILRSRERYPRDKELLLQEYKEYKNPRSIFYLARTCQCLGEYQEAYKYFEERANIKFDFWEERFHSMYACGQLASDWEVKRKWYMDAWELAHRVEPLVKMAEHYRKEKDILSMYMVLKIACDLEYPTTHKLSVDINLYEYTRWHLMGICGFYVGKFEDGKKGAQKAVNVRNLEEDKRALDVYIKRELMIETNFTKELYVHHRMGANGISKEQAEREWIEYRI